MTYEETRQILNILYVAYPNSYMKWTKSQRRVAHNLWHEMFKTLPYGVVMLAVKKELAENRTNFAPSIGEVMYQVVSLVSVLDANAAWEDVCYVVRTVDFENIPSAVGKLDEISRKIVTSRDIVQMKESSAAMENFRPMFFSAYKKEKDKRENQAVKTGNLMSISNEKKLLELRDNTEALLIESGEDSEE